MSDLRDALDAAEKALTWALRNSGGECPADYPAGYVKAMKALLLARAALGERRVKDSLIPQWEERRGLPYVRSASPGAGKCPKCGHGAGDIFVGDERRPHTCCGHPDCMRDVK